MNTYLKLITESWNKVKSNWKYFFYALGFDFVFLVLYGFVTYAYKTKIFEYVMAIGTTAISAQGVVSKESPSFADIFLTAETKTYFLVIILLAVLVLVSVYFLFTFLVGISNYISFNIDSFSKKKLAKYLKSLFFITIPWFVILAIHEVIALYYSFLDTARGTLGLGATYFRIVDAIFIFILIYFILISFMLERKQNFRNSFKLGLKKFTKIFPIYLLLMIAFLLLAMLTSPLLMLSRIVAILYDVFIVLGFITFARIVMKKVVLK